MNSRKAKVRQELEKLPYVTRTWFEWTQEGKTMLKTLVVEVNFDTDPNSEAHSANDLEEIPRVVLKAQTTMVVSHLRIVPKR